MDSNDQHAQPRSIMNSILGDQIPFSINTSILGSSSIRSHGSLFGAQSLFQSINSPGSVSNNAGPSSSLAQAFGPGSMLNSNNGPGSMNSYGGERDPGSVMNPSTILGASSSHYPEIPSININLAIPMTPLARNGENEMPASNELYEMPASHIPAIIPQTPMSMAMDIPSPQLQNIVATVNLDVKLDLKEIALHARNAEYNPKRFAAVIMRIRDPRTTALIFSSGKMVVTGAKSEKDSRLAARKYARIVQKLGFNAKFIEFKIQNMVGSTDVRFPIYLEGLCVTHAQFSIYEPEIFPGLIYRMVKPRVVLLIFVSGKVVITGAKLKKDIDDAFSQIYPILRSFKK